MLLMLTFKDISGDNGLKGNTLPVELACKPTSGTTRDTKGNDIILTLEGDADALKNFLTAKFGEESNGRWSDKGINPGNVVHPASRVFEINCGQMELQNI